MVTQISIGTLISAAAFLIFSIPSYDTPCLTHQYIEPIRPINVPNPHHSRQKRRPGPPRQIDNEIGRRERRTAQLRRIDVDKARSDVDARETRNTAGKKGVEAGFPEGGAVVTVVGGIVEQCQKGEYADKGCDGHEEGKTAAGVAIAAVSTPTAQRLSEKPPQHPTHRTPSPKHGHQTRRIRHRQSSLLPQEIIQKHKHDTPRNIAEKSLQQQQRVARMIRQRRHEARPRELAIVRPAGFGHHSLEGTFLAAAGGFCDLEGDE